MKYQVSCNMILLVVYHIWQTLYFRILGDEIIQAKPTVVNKQAKHFRVFFTSEYRTKDEKKTSFRVSPKTKLERRRPQSYS